MVEIQQAVLTVEYIRDRTDGEAIALSSLIPDVVTPHRDMDYRALGCFLLAHVWTLPQPQSPAKELGDSERFPTLYFPNRGQSRESEREKERGLRNLYSCPSRSSKMVETYGRLRH